MLPRNRYLAGKPKARLAAFSSPGKGDDVRVSHNHVGSRTDRSKRAVEDSV
jgi:hypothetical protein